MVTCNADSSQGDVGTTPAMPPQPTPPLSPGPLQFEQRSRTNTVFKTGPLFISSKAMSKMHNEGNTRQTLSLFDCECSRLEFVLHDELSPLPTSCKGMGWTSWKKRWFILTRTSLVFFRNDPNAPPQRGGEANVTLGGIDLNNSGSVVVRADKKLLTVLFPDGRDGRAFTLKAETSEDMYEWKSALESALAQAPSAAIVMGQNAIFRPDTADANDGTFEHSEKDKKSAKSMVIGRPILLALEDVDGSPSFLEKALRFIEQIGIKVEGILRQSADVEEVEHRVREYDQGKTEFSPDEDAHVIADCVKHVLRELPSSPVPTSCCTLLLDAIRKDRDFRVNSMRVIMAEEFPEPNRLLLQRILKMMQIVASHKSENLMSTSAIAACMAPLLLRPLLAGDCEIEDDFEMGGDGSVQLLRAAAAANHAQAIVITLMEEFDKIFLDVSLSPRVYTGSEGSGSGSEDEEITDEEILEDDGYHDVEHDLEMDMDNDPERSLSGSFSESSGNDVSDLYDDKDSEGHESQPQSPQSEKDLDDKKEPSKDIRTPLTLHDDVETKDSLWRQSDNYSSISAVGFPESSGNVPASASPKLKSPGLSSSSCIIRSTSESNESNSPSVGNKSTESVPSPKRPIHWGCTAGRKKLSVEYIDFSGEDEAAILKLELAKVELQNKITKEVEGNAALQESLERQKQALHERRLALEKDVLRLQAQLQKERDLRATLEAGLNMHLEHLSISSIMDGKTRARLEEIVLAEADVTNLKKKVADLQLQLHQRHQIDNGSICESCNEHWHTTSHQATWTQQKDFETSAILCEKSPRNEVSTVVLDSFADSSGKAEQVEVASVDSVHSKEPSTVWPDSSIKSSKNPEPVDLSSCDDINSIMATTNFSMEKSLTVGLHSSKKSSAMVEGPSSGVEHESVTVFPQDQLSLPNKQPSQKQLSDITRRKGTKSTGSNASLSMEESSAVGSAASKKSTGKGEGITTVSALTKLTNRLNFLKERRLHIATEARALEVSTVPASKSPLASPHPSRASKSPLSSPHPSRGNSR